MAAETGVPDPQTEELLAAVRAIRDRVRARYPEGVVAGDVPLADLTPVVHARDAAEGKVAAIGTVNPRPPGLLNFLVQRIKKLAARALDWHVREQIEFNRAALNCVEALMEALNESNRALAVLAHQTAARFEELRALGEEARELKDIRSHWGEWRKEWERKLSVNEVQFLRSVADLQTAFQHRATLMESNFRDLTRAQHSEFTVALERTTLEVQKRLWADLEKIREEYERLIHAELRVVRQRGLRQAESSPPVGLDQTAPRIDWLKFADRFRGSPEYVREKQRLYLPCFQGRSEVVDLGCGRGEFLEIMKEAGVAARGIDLSEEAVALCRSRGLEAEVADLFPWLAALPDASVDGIFSAQVIEHLPPARVPEMIALAAAKLKRGGLLAIETPNPECLAIFATHFYLDPTHTRPLPPQLLAFYFEEAGLGRIEVRRLSPALESMPALAPLPEEFRQAFFGGLDYAVLGIKLS